METIRPDRIEVKLKRLEFRIFVKDSAPPEIPVFQVATNPLLKGRTMRQRRNLSVENLGQREMFAANLYAELNYSIGGDGEEAPQEEFSLNFFDGTQVGSEGFKAKPPQIPNQVASNSVGTETGNPEIAANKALV